MFSGDAYLKIIAFISMSKKRKKKYLKDWFLIQLIYAILFYKIRVYSYDVPNE